MKVDNPFNGVMIDIVTNKVDKLSECDRSEDDLEFDCTQHDYCEKIYKPFLLDFTSYEYKINPGIINLELRNAIDDLTTEMYAFDVYESFNSSGNDITVYDENTSAMAEAYHTNARLNNTNSGMTKVIQTQGNFLYRDIFCSRITDFIQGQLITNVKYYPYEESFHSSATLGTCELKVVTAWLYYDYFEHFYSSANNFRFELGPPSEE